MEAYKFWKLSSSFGSFKKYLNVLRRQPEFWKFGNFANRMMRDKLVFTIPKKLRQVLNT